MLKYLQDSEDLKVSLRELQEQLESLEEAGISIMQSAKQARNERGQKLFQIFRQEENEVYMPSLAGWDTQMKGLVELDRRCQELMQEVELSSERQEVLAGLVEDKIRVQSKATETYYETIFEEMGELDEKSFVTMSKSKGKSENVASLTIETPFPLSRARLPWRVIWKRCARSLRRR